MQAIPGIRRAAGALRWLADASGVAGAPGAVLDRAEVRAGARPVLLLHGWPATRRRVDVLERRLRRDGFCVLSLEVGSLRAALTGRGLDDLADGVRLEVERLYARHPALAPLEIVGHSSGGLVAAYYVKRLGGWRRTRALVTLGAPHRGTPLALLAAPLGPLARRVGQMAPGSDFLVRLLAGPWPTRVRLASIWSRRDGAAPFPSCVIDTHGLPQLANVEVEADHAGLLTRRRVYETIARELRTAEADAPIVRGPLTAVAGGARPAGAGVPPAAHDAA